MQCIFFYIMWTLINLALCLLSAVAAMPAGDIEIFGGHNIDITQVPYQISLRRHGTHHCGGSIISSTHVLTAAHCVENTPASSFTVNAGSTNKEQNGVVVGVVRVTSHPRYIGPSNNWDHDFAVLKLAQPLQFSNKIKAIPLASQGSQVAAGQPIMFSGWGRTRASGSDMAETSLFGMNKNESDVSSSPAILQGVVLPAVSNSDCQARWSGNVITNNMMCAGGLPSGGQATCEGDSGGPAALNGVLVGAVSWGPDGNCAPANIPVVQARVSALRSWIDSQMN